MLMNFYLDHYGRYVDAGKPRALGWSAQYDIKTGVERTIDILKALEQG